MIKEKVLVFDFDGTIAITADIIFDVLNKHVPTLNREIYLDEMRKLFFHRTWKEILRALYLEFRVKTSSKSIRTEINSRILEAKLVEDLRDILLKLKRDNYKLIILSSNFRENIVAFLENNNLDIFDNVYGDGHLLSKYRQLKKIVLDHPQAEIFYIGDELRDIDTARRANVHEIGVTWGLNTRKDFEDFKTQRILEKPEELLSL